MEFSVKSGTPEKQRSSCLIVGVFDSRKLSSSAEQIDEVTGGALSAILRRGDLEGKAGQTLILHNLPNLPSERVLLVGCGKEKEFNEARYRDTTSRAIAALRDTGATEVTSYLTDLEVKGHDDVAWKVRHAVEATEGTMYRFDQMKSRQDNHRRALKRMVLAVPKRSDLDAGELAIKQGVAIAAGIKLTRDLGNLPPNICTPTYLAEQAQHLAQQFASLKVTVLDHEEIEKLGMGSFLSVARGSRQPPKFIIIEYMAGNPEDAPVVLVGKGITFDTGGISIKPADKMDEMKYDMCGAASVLGTMHVAADLKIPLNIVGLIPTCENMPGSQASRPGDIVKTMSGQTVEILNTDAEGRLILCDALTYAERYNPAAVVDIATLTGAIVISLGAHASGLFANNDGLAREIVNAGKYTYDRVWHMPLWDEYQRQLESNFADMANIGGREGGSITAACFLSRYTKNYKWAHIDIAGTAWKSGKEKGATGRPVPLLTQFLLSRAANQSEAAA